MTRRSSIITLIGINKYHMQLRNLEIRNFRGIKSLDWVPDGNFICLIGPGDSTKSTILDSIELALSPRWKIDFNDSDFHNGDTESNIEITITVGGLPERLKADNKFGLDLRGWNGELGLHDEPEDGDELVLTVQLRVTSSLEPNWFVLNDRKPEGTRISSQDREVLGVARIGDFLDRHLAWRRGSALSRVTGKGDDLADILAQASRAARQTMEPESLPALQAAADRVQTLGQHVGVQPKEGYRPRLDVQSVDINSGGVSLHDGDIPVRRAGLGTRRLVTLALERDAISKGGIALIDEVEHGLEPHRVRRLLRALQTEHSGDKSASTAIGQVLLTTHSGTVVDELGCGALRIVRSEGGVTKILTIPADFQKDIRRSPEAFLGSALLVCEGETEVGFGRALDSWWIDEQQLDPFAVRGVIPIDGRGATNAPRYAMALRTLGYRVAYWGDSDYPLKPSADDMRKAGITVLLWDDGLSLEERIAADLDWPGVQQALDLAAGINNEDKVRGSVISKYKDSSGLVGSFSTWTDSKELRRAIGAAAKGADWFKDIDRGERLGMLVTKHLPSVKDSILSRKIGNLRRWLDGDG